MFEKEPILLTEKDTPLPLLVDKEEKTEVEAKVSDGKAQIAVILKRKDKNTHQQWKDILSPPEECIDEVWYDSKKDQDVKMKDDDKRLIDEPDRYTPAIKHQEKKKTYLWLQVACEGDQLDFDQPFLKKSGAFEVFYDASYNPWPVKKTYNGHKRRLGSGYGPRNVKNRPEASKFHRGLDINFGGGYDDFGAPVISTHDGIIVEAKDNIRGSGGRTVTVEAEDGSFQTRYNHLSEITVSLNQNVSKGQTIGKIGASAWGKEKGSDSHLHYAIKKKDSNGKLQWYNPTEGKENKEENMVDPQSWIK
ncbi:hypothetical protein AB832_02705 [Flavobacteriaceae bacterium (ex Bugula neritina AB1)]|nr:hypothetical protein AB832_02705 [Flavobacteriaceae bacterium (ex Bugula neritina AB1)]